MGFQGVQGSLERFRRLESADGGQFFAAMGTWLRARRIQPTLRRGLFQELIVINAIEHKRIHLARFEPQLFQLPEDALPPHKQAPLHRVARHIGIHHPCGYEQARLPLGILKGATRSFERSNSEASKSLRVQR